MVFFQNTSSQMWSKSSSDAGFLHKSDDLMVKLCLYLYGVKVHVVSEASEDTVTLEGTVVDFIHRMIYSISDPQNCL